MRYTAPINLKKDGKDVPKEDSLNGVARVFLGKMMEINSSDPTGQKWTRRLTDGSIITGYIPAVGMLPVVTVTSPPPSKKEPEFDTCQKGLIVTPTSSTNPQGWGFPREGKDYVSPLGTPGGENPDLLFVSPTGRSYNQDFSHVPQALFFNSYVADKKNIYTWAAKHPDQLSKGIVTRYNSVAADRQLFKCGKLWDTLPADNMLGISIHSDIKTEVSYVYAVFQTVNGITIQRRVNEAGKPWVLLLTYVIPMFDTAPQFPYGIAAASATTGEMAVCTGIEGGTVTGTDIAPVGHLVISLQEVPVVSYVGLTEPETAPYSSSVIATVTNSTTSSDVPEPDGSGNTAFYTITSSSTDTRTKVTITSDQVFSPVVCMLDYEGDTLKLGEVTKTGSSGNNVESFIRTQNGQEYHQTNNINQTWLLSFDLDVQDVISTSANNVQTTSLSFGNLTVPLETTTNKTESDTWTSHVIQRTERENNDVNNPLVMVSNNASYSFIQKFITESSIQTIGAIDLRESSLALAEKSQLDVSNGYLGPGNNGEVVKDQVRTLSCTVKDISGLNTFIDNSFTETLFTTNPTAFNYTYWFFPSSSSSFSGESLVPFAVLSIASLYMPVTSGSFFRNNRGFSVDHEGKLFLSQEESISSPTVPSNFLDSPTGETMAYYSRYPQGVNTAVGMVDPKPIYKYPKLV